MIKKILLTILGIIGTAILMYIAQAYTNSKKYEIRRNIDQQIAQEQYNAEKEQKDRMNKVYNEEPEKYLEKYVRVKKEELPIRVDPHTSWTSIKIDENYLIYYYTLDEGVTITDKDLEKQKKYILSQKQYLQNEKDLCDRTNRQLIYYYSDYKGDTIGYITISPDEL